MSKPAQAESWVLPIIDGPVLPLRRSTNDLDAIEREAWEHGYSEGHATGLEAAQQETRAALAEGQRRLQQVQAILDLMSKPLADLDYQVHRQLASLACAIARQLVRRELKSHPDEIIAVVRETVALLPASARAVCVHLHPEDAALVRGCLSAAVSEPAWSITEDPVLARGGCRITSDSSSIDAQLEQRLGAVIAAALGDERNAQGGS